MNLSQESQVLNLQWESIEGHLCLSFDKLWEITCPNERELEHKVLVGELGMDESHAVNFEWSMGEADEFTPVIDYQGIVVFKAEYFESRFPTNDGEASYEYFLNPTAILVGFLPFVTDLGIKRALVTTCLKVGGAI